ncbi:hypothetical protein X777_03832 [Ooceraea biroi]|uniref:Uncharacterized protein n=1 Tax=Ooceraea biroi TaxID=2015173 RepID=A0A026WHP2_OOCBI|nr:hypothetical protein X777_03832 [Ooceraea biroi]
MTGLLRRGEESGGYDRRRVQIITIIIFPGNMAAERGWPPGSLVKERRRESERERERVNRVKEGGSARRASREGYHNITNHRRRDVSIQPLTLTLARSSPPRARLSCTCPPRSRIMPPPRPQQPSRRFAYTVPKFPTRNSHERSHPAIVALYIPTPRPFIPLSLSLSLFLFFPPLPPPPPSLPPPPPPPPRSPSAILPLVALPRPSPSHSISASAVLRIYDPVENVRPYPRHDLALVSTPNGSRRSTRILA